MTETSVKASTTLIWRWEPQEILLENPFEFTAEISRLAFHAPVQREVKEGIAEIYADFEEDHELVEMGMAEYAEFLKKEEEIDLTKIPKVDLGRVREDLLTRESLYEEYLNHKMGHRSDTNQGRKLS